MTSVSWVERIQPGRLGLMPRPRGGDWLEDEILALSNERTDVLVSFLGPFEVEELDLSREATVCARNQIEFISFPITDRSTPTSMIESIVLVRGLSAHIKSGKSVVLHCRLGIGRAGIFSAAILVALGEKPPEAVRRISAARGIQIPDTQEQLAWLEHFAREFMAEGQ